MLRWTLTLCFILLFGGTRLPAQILAEMLSDTISLTCSEDCFTLLGDFYKPLKTSTYSIDSPNYSPQSFTTGTVLNLADDKFSSSINMGFSFCFFENTYSSIVIGANGLLTFNPSYASQNCSFSTMQTIPYFNSTFPDNSILGPFVDINFSQGGHISYYTTGTAPWRKFVVNYNGANFFSTSCPNVFNTFQVVLNETSNIIEINIQNKGICNSSITDWLNFASLGIQNIGATTAITAPNKNSSIWTATNKSYRFIPAGPPAYNISWYDTGNLIGTGTDSVTHCNSNPNSAKFYYEYSLACPAMTISDTAYIYKPSIYPDSISVTVPTCPLSSDGEVTIYPLLSTNSYAINNGTWQSSNTFSNLSNNIYTLYMQDSSGCIWDSSIYIANNSAVGSSLDSIHMPTCGDSNGTIYTSTSGGYPPYTYSWNPGTSTTDSLTGVPGGSYTLSVTDSLGCMYATSFTLPEISGILFDTTLITHPLCGDSTGSIDLLLNGGNNNYNFTWYPSVSNNGSASGLQAGGYTIIISDTNGCDTTLYIQLYDQYTVSAQKDTIETSCGLNNGQALVTPISGLAPFSYSWTSGSTDSLATDLAPGMHSCTITASNGCTLTLSFFVDSSISPSIYTTYSNAYCDSNNGNAIVFNNNMITPISYLWSNSQTNNSVSGLGPGTYWIQVTDSLGCVLIDTVQIGDDGSPHLEVVSYIPPLCYGDSTASVTLSASGGTAPYKYSTDGSYFQTTAQLDSMPGGSYVLYVRDANSCTKDTLINFPQPDSISFSAEHDQVICYGDKVQMRVIDPQGGLGYLRFGLDGVNFRKDRFFNALEAGTYTIYAVDSVGCQNQLIHTIDQPSAPLSIDLDMTRISCYQDSGGVIDAQVTGGWPPYKLLWSEGSSGYSISYLTKGWYSLEVVDDLGCEVTDSIALKEEECCEAWLPNAFTPNGDGSNDRFQIHTRADLASVIFEVYNRNGQRVFHSIRPNGSWDGKFDGEDADIGVYIYHLRYQCEFSKEWESITGDVTLIR